MGRQHTGIDTRVVPRVELQVRRRPLQWRCYAARWMCWPAWDAAGVPEVVRQDREVDAESKSAARQLITFMMEDPRTISSSLDLLIRGPSAPSSASATTPRTSRNTWSTWSVGRDVRHIGLDAIVIWKRASRPRREWHETADLVGTPRRRNACLVTRSASTCGAADRRG